MIPGLESKFSHASARTPDAAQCSQKRDPQPENTAGQPIGCPARIDSKAADQFGRLMRNTTLMLRSDGEIAGVTSMLFVITSRKFM